jgi:hypothetical protein
MCKKKVNKKKDEKKSFILRMTTHLLLLGLIFNICKRESLFLSKKKKCMTLSRNRIRMIAVFSYKIQYSLRVCCSSQFVREEEEEEEEGE